MNSVWAAIRTAVSILVAAIPVGTSLQTVRADDSVVDLWPGPAPGEAQITSDLAQRIARDEPKNTDERVFAVSRPTLTVRLAKPETACGTAVLVCPGGGYNVLAWAKEGLEIADWLNSIGVHAFVLKYRVPRREPDYSTPPLQDAQRAMRMIRSRAQEWGIDQDRIGVLGFSAGGNLSVNLALSTESAYSDIDAVDTASFAPAFMVPVYAAYLGDPNDDQRLNPALQIDASTPPAFFVVTQDDKNRGIHAALMFAELTRQRVPAEVHVYMRGGHGYGLRPSEYPVSGWTSDCAAWLRESGYLKPRTR